MQKASLQISGGTTVGDRGVMLAGRDRGAVLRNSQERPFPEPTRSLQGLWSFRGPRISQKASAT